MLASSGNNQDAGSSHQAWPRGSRAHERMDCMDVTADKFFVDKTPPAALHQTIIVLRWGAPFHPLEAVMVRVQVWRDVLPLNKINEMPSIPLRDRKLNWEQPGHGDQIPISYPHWGIMAHVLKVRWWRVNFIELPPRATLRVALSSASDAESKSPAMKQSASRFRGCRKSELIWQGGGSRAPTKLLGPWGVTPSVGFRFLRWASGCPSDDGSIWIGNAYSCDESSFLSNGW